MSKIEIIELDKIQPNPYQPRKNIDLETVKELAKSIDFNGLINPITIGIINNQYVLIAGQRRMLAFKELNKKEIPSISIGEVTDEELLRFSVTENIQREEMSDFDIANAIRDKKNKGLSNVEISTEFGKSASWVSKMLSILNLDDSVIEEFKNGNLDHSKASAMSGLNNEEQKELLKDIQENELTKKEIEKKVKDKKNLYDSGIEFNKYKKLSNDLNEHFKLPEFFKISNKKIEIAIEDDLDLNVKLELLGLQEFKI